MATHVVASFLCHMLGRHIPGAGSSGQLFRILLEIESGEDQTVSDGVVCSVVGKVDLIISQIESAIVGAEVGTRNHGDVVRVRGMEERVEVGEAGALGS